MQVEPLDVRGAHPGLRRVAGNDPLLGGYYGRRAVPPFTVHSLSRVRLDELRVVDLRAEVGFHGRGVDVQAVRAELEAVASHGGGELGGEEVRILGGAPADVVGKQELRVPLDSEEGVGVAEFRVGELLAVLRLLLHAHEAPQLVSLDVLDRDVTDQAGKESFALRAGHPEETTNRVAVHAGHPLRRTDRGALGEERENEGGIVQGDPHGTERPGRDDAEALPASLAEPAGVALPVLSPADRRPAAGAAGGGGRGGGGGVHGSRLAQLDLL